MVELRWKRWSWVGTVAFEWEYPHPYTPACASWTSSPLLIFIAKHHLRADLYLPQVLALLGEWAWKVIQEQDRELFTRAMESHIRRETWHPPTSRGDDEAVTMPLLTSANGETLLTGDRAGQAALHGLLTKIRDIGLPLLAVNRVETVD